MVKLQEICGMFLICYGLLKKHDFFKYIYQLLIWWLTIKRIVKNNEY